MELEPSLALLIDCCRCRLGLLGEARLAERLRGADGERLAAAARRHALESLAWSLLRQSNLILPGTAALGAEARRTAERGRHLDEESLRLHRTLAAASLPHLFLGHGLLGRLALQEPALTHGPIRLLVLPAALPKVAAALSALGYVQEEPDPSVDTADWHRRVRRSCWRSDDGIMLSLESRLADHPAILPTVTASTPPLLVETGGGTLPTLPLPLLLCAVAVEGTVKVWHRLAWLAEFAGLVRRFPRAGLGQAVDLAARLGAERPLAASLALSHRLLGTDVPDSLWFDGGARRLLDRSLASLTEPLLPAEHWRGRAALATAPLLLQPGSRFFVGAALRQVGGALTR